jgi:hypothetical protein
MGTMPRIVASDVIRTGRRRTRQAMATASAMGIPWRRRLRVNSTMRIEFETTIPVIMTTPIRDITFSVVCVSRRKRITPVIPGGTARRMISGSTKELNCAMRMR